MGESAIPITATSATEGDNFRHTGGSIRRNGRQIFPPSAYKCQEGPGTGSELMGNELTLSCVCNPANSIFPHGRAAVPTAAPA